MEKIYMRKFGKALKKCQDLEKKYGKAWIKYGLLPKGFRFGIGDNEELNPDFLQGPILPMPNMAGGRGFRLSNRGLTELSPDIGSNRISKKLLDLELDHNQLTTLPSEIENLTNLEYLTLARNNFTTLPLEIGNLTSLNTLLLDHNQLTSLPPEIGNLTNLKQLNLARNQLTTLPPEIGNLTNLEDQWGLDLSHNQLTTLPREIENLTNLGRLELSDNHFTTLPPEMENLEDLDLSHNQLTGTLAPEIGNFTNLRGLNLRGNPLTALPPQIGNLTNLRSLNLRDTGTMGPNDDGDWVEIEPISLPRAIGQIPNLRIHLPRIIDNEGIEIPHPLEGVYEAYRDDDRERVQQWHSSKKKGAKHTAALAHLKKQGVASHERIALAKYLFGKKKNAKKRRTSKKK